MKGSNQVLRVFLHRSQSHKKMLNNVVVVVVVVGLSFSTKTSGKSKNSFFFFSIGELLT